MDNRFTITLIRHLPTKGNQEKKYIGWTDEPIVLGVQTKKQSRNLTRVIGSDLVRCKQTAAILFNGVPYIATKNLRECAFGDWEEKTFDDLKALESYIEWLTNPRRVAPPNGESLEQMESRVLKEIIHVVKEMEEQPTIVTHGGPIRFLLTKFANVEKAFWDWEVPHGSMYKLSWSTKEDVLEEKRCMSFSVEHLMENEHM